MATEDSSGTAARISGRATTAGTHKGFIVALLLRAILAGLIQGESRGGPELGAKSASGPLPPRSRQGAVPPAQLCGPTPKEADFPPARSLLSSDTVFRPERARRASQRQKGS